MNMALTGNQALSNLDTSGSEKACYSQLRSHNRFQLKRRAVLGKLEHGIIPVTCHTEYLKIELRKKIPFAVRNQIFFYNFQYVFFYIVMIIFNNTIR